MSRGRKILGILAEQTKQDSDNVVEGSIENKNDLSFIDVNSEGENNTTPFTIIGSNVTEIEDYGRLEFVENVEIEVINTHCNTDCLHFESKSPEEISNPSVRPLVYNTINDLSENHLTLYCQRSLSDEKEDDKNISIPCASTSDNNISYDDTDQLRPDIGTSISNSDYISDDSDLNQNVKLVDYSDTDSSNPTEYPVKSRKRKKRFQVTESTWFAQRNKKLRETGKGYFGKKKNGAKWNYEEPRKPRIMESRCKCKQNTGVIKCFSLQEEHRRQIFEAFWKMSWGEKKVFVNSQVVSVPPKRARNRKNSKETKRGQSLQYFLKVKDQNFRVCRTMFLNTLGIGRWTVLHWKNISETRAPSIYRQNSKSVTPVIDRRKCLAEFLTLLPVIESHYCRASTSKKYLLSEWKSKQSLYEFYINDWCKFQKCEPLSIATFSKAFENENFALFHPKKDECEKCVCFKNGSISEEEFKNHMERKIEAREEKDKDKRKGKYVFTVDLQAVLMAPKSNVSTLYYKTKLQVHNLCFYNIINGNVSCYLWNEAEGGVNAEEFASIWVSFIENKVLPQITDQNNDRIITVYTDGCSYQNRNCVMANALLNLAINYNVTIEQKFLEVGHTQMEVDSVHSVIEQKLKNRLINVPADYITVCRQARKNPSPYDVTYLTFDFFKKFDAVQFYKSIRPGRAKGDAKVTDIRAISYTPDGNIHYKMHFREEWKDLPQRRSPNMSSCLWSQLANLHTGRRKITARKYEDLQVIKKTLPADYHKFYDDLPHE